MNLKFPVLMLSLSFWACSQSPNNDFSEMTEAAEEAADLPSIAPAFDIEPADSSLEYVAYTDDHGITEHYYRSTRNNAKQGVYKKVDGQGKLIEEANFVNDTLHGLRIIYYEKGDTQIVENYQKGYFEGAYKAYYESGQLELLGHYVDNTMKGKWYRYYPTGELMEIVTFEGNEENGPFVEFYQNGNKKAEGTYLEGDNEDGLLSLYDEEGTLVRKMECNKGICKTIWRFGQGES